MSVPQPFSCMVEVSLANPVRKAAKLGLQMLECFEQD